MEIHREFLKDKIQLVKEKGFQYLWPTMKIQIKSTSKFNPNHDQDNNDDVDDKDCMYEWM